MAAKPNATNISQTAQEEHWAGTFGKEYSERNRFSPAEVDALYEDKYGVTRTALNARFLKDIPKEASILEVGCNLGNQLLLLKEMGFVNLHGIEINDDIVREAKVRAPFADIAQGSAMRIPYPNAHFDLIFTAGLLIHISPKDLETVMKEISRCTKSWIWGCEYYASQTTEVCYRGHEDLLWKTNYASQYLHLCRNLEIVLEEKLQYRHDSNVDTMFLLRRKSPRSS